MWLIFAIFMGIGTNSWGVFFGSLILGQGLDTLNDRLKTIQKKLKIPDEDDIED